MKVFLLFLFLSLSQVGQAKVFDSLYVGIASSGPGGSALGHSFFLFCEEDYHLHLKRCTPIEYNLDINLGEKYIETKNLDFIDKFEAFNNANFMIFEHEDQRLFENKYFSRAQTLTYFKYKKSRRKINKIYRKIQREKRKRLKKQHKDYRIFSNNCATKILDVLKVSEGKSFDPFKSRSFYDLDLYFSNFPILLQDTIKASNLFEAPMLFQVREIK
jgi:hypothetical protein